MDKICEKEDLLIKTVPNNRLESISRSNIHSIIEVKHSSEIKTTNGKPIETV